jgi:CRISPR system Cascade subunit CasD
MSAHALYLRLEGPLQAWGVASNWTVRDTGGEPSKSGIAGMLCCALGLRRDAAEMPGWLERINALRFGVREDIPGRLLKDYHTVGAGIGNLSANGKIKITESSGEIETVLSNRYYITDASFLAVLWGDKGTLTKLQEALISPVWPLFLGRKCCPPSMPILEKTSGQLSQHDSLEKALAAEPWRPRIQDQDAAPGERGLRAVVEATASEPNARPVSDTLLRLAPPQYGRRWVREAWLNKFSQEKGMVAYATQYPRRPKYASDAWRTTARSRREEDKYSCVVCHWAQAKRLEVHHKTYANVPNEIVKTDLVTLCKQCHFAVTMLEYEYGMDSMRIDPIDVEWLRRVIGKRKEIRAEQRARHLMKRR